GRILPARRRHSLRRRQRSCADAEIAATTRVQVRKGAAAVLRNRRTNKASCSRRSDRKSTRLNSSHVSISYAVFCLKKKKPSIITLDRLPCSSRPAYYRSFHRRRNRSHSAPSRPECSRAASLDYPCPTASTASPTSI